jgi:hypothetical protein
MAFIAPLVAAIPAWVGTAMTVASAGMAAVSMRQQYQSAKAADSYNAGVKKQQADAASATANQREESQRRTTRVASGARRAVASESGTGLDGSNADAMRQSEMLAELDALNIRYQGASDSSGFLAGAELDKMSAKANGRAANMAAFSGTMKTAATALGGKW